MSHYGQSWLSRWAAHRIPGVVKSLKTLPGLYRLFCRGYFLGHVHRGDQTERVLGAFIVLCAVFHGMKGKSKTRCWGGKANGDDSLVWGVLIFAIPRIPACSLVRRMDYSPEEEHGFRRSVMILILSAMPFSACSWTPGGRRGAVVPGDRVGMAIWSASRC